jgi:hypothetical protein
MWFMQWFALPNSTEIVAWGVDKVAGGVIVGLVVLIISTYITINHIEKRRETRQEQNKRRDE